MKLKLDDWQKEVLEEKGNIVLRSGRQVGKSTIIAIKAAEYAAKNKNKTIMVIASVERQARLLFEKVLFYIQDNYKREIKRGKERPTKHKISLRNGSVIHCLPTGLSGYGIRGFTIDLLIADEAAFIPEDVWSAVSPMIATRTKEGARLILLSTPFGKKGYFYDCFNDESFRKFHISSENCPRIDKDYLKREKKRMTELQYTQEYLGEFVDELMQFFPTELIDRNMTIDEKPKTSFKVGEYYLGVDFAGYGGDENAFVVLKKTGDDKVEMEEVETRTGEQIKHNITGDTIDRIISLDRKYHFKRIYVDDGGLGSPIFDILRDNDRLKRRVEALNNARRSIEYDSDKKERKKGLMKNDMYGNLLRLMERGHIKILKKAEVRQSLKSIQYEYKESVGMRVYGNYTHITEALIRACWCVKDKHLNIYVY